jgi:hypothetical protein
MLSFASRGLIRTRACPSSNGTSRWLLSTAARPIRRPVSPEERAAIRAARKEQATQRLAQLGGESGQAAASLGTTTIKAPNMKMSRWMWYAAVALPGGLLLWGASDEESLPARVSRYIGLSDLVGSFTESFAKPSFDKLLPDWSQVCQSDCMHA